MGTEQSVDQYLDDLPPAGEIGRVQAGLQAFTEGIDIGAEVRDTTVWLLVCVQVALLLRQPGVDARRVTMAAIMRLGPRGRPEAAIAQSRGRADSAAVTAMPSASCAGLDSALPAGV